MKAMLLFILCTAVTIHAETPPEITLANKYHIGIDVGDYMVSEKYDGVRAYWNGKQLLTRSGMELNPPISFLKQLPKYPLDGELWFGRQSFSRSAALIKRLPKNDKYQSEWNAVKYVIFDAPKQPGGFSSRLDFLKKNIKKNRPQLQIAAQWRVKNHGELQSYLKEMSAQGAEGLILRLRDAPYRPGRSDDLLKFKTWEDAEATVIAIIPGKGRLKNEMGSLLVKLDDGRELRIGSGFYHEERLSPPTVGSRITFRYQGYTNGGLPRFAHFWRNKNQSESVLP